MTTRQSIRDQIMMCACDPDDRMMSNQQIADDIGTNVAEVSKCRAQLVRDGLLHRGTPGRVGIDYTALGMRHCVGRGWRVWARVAGGGVISIDDHTDSDGDEAGESAE